MAQGVETNGKAWKFQEYLIENDISVFGTETLDDKLQTVIFRSRVEVHGQILPMALLIDTSIFTVIRTQIIAGIPEESRVRVQECLNRLNAQFKVFKYYMREDGVILLDICLPYEDDDTFNPAMIRTMLSILVSHLETQYEGIMKAVWGGNA